MAICYDFRNFDIAFLFAENQKLRAENMYLREQNSTLRSKFLSYGKMARRKISLTKNIFEELKIQLIELKNREALKSQALLYFERRLNRLNKVAFRRYVRKCDFCGARKTLKLPCSCRICEDCFTKITCGKTGTCLHLDV